jgi:hypothetical protein
MLASVKSGGAPDDMAVCATDGLAKSLTRDEFIAVSKAKKEEDVPKELAEKANAIVLECALGSTDASTVAPASTETTVAAAAQTAAQTAGTKAAPFAPKTVAALPNGYDVSVNSYTPAASALVASANEFNDKPAPGSQYVLVNLTVKNTGGDSDKRIPGYDLNLKAISKSGKSYESANCNAVTPEPLDKASDLFKGSSISGNVCFVVSDADSSGLVMYVDATLPDYSSVTYYFNLV